MKTLQIGNVWFPENAGGLDHVYYDCTRYLPQVGVEVRGLVVGSKDVAQDSSGQVQTFASAESTLWQRWRGVRQAVHRMLAEDEYSLVVSHFALYTFPVLDRIGGRSTVMHFHGPWALESLMEGGNAVITRSKWALEWIVYQRMAGFIVLSEAFRNILHREYWVPLECIHVIPPGMNTECFDTTITRNEARTKLGWPPDRPVILAVRRLARRMGLENLISAVVKVCSRYPDILLLVAGKGALGPTLQTQIEELGLTEHVRLLGFVPAQQLGLVYRAADLSVVPTIGLEGFGLILIESLAAGTPVLGTPVGGIPEILRPFSEDLVLEGSSAEQIAQGILEALSGQRKLPSSQACETYVREHYAWPVVARRIKSVYQAVLDGKTL